MKPIRWITLATLLISTLVIYTNSSVAQVSGEPNFVTQWRTGNPSMPWGIAVGENDLVYVALYQLSLVQIFDREGELIRTLGGQGGLPGQFLGPVGLALGANDELYVADSENSRVQVFSPDGDFIREFTHPEKAEARFKPWGIALDSQQNVYVSVLNTHEIHKFSPSGNLISTFGGFGFNDGEFVGPTGMAVSGDNELYIVDSLAFRIQVLSLEGEFIRKWGSLCDLFITPGRGCVDPDGDGPLEAGDGQLSSPWGVALDDSGLVYVADSANKRVVVFDENGQFITKWGTLGTASAEFDNNVGIALATDGDIYVSDLNNNRVQRFAFQGNNSGQPGTDGGANGDDPPVVLSVSLPDELPADGSTFQGVVTISDPNGHATRAQLRVIDGKFDPIFVEISTSADQSESSFSFDFSCPISQRVVLKLVIEDARGNESVPEQVNIRCGDPPIGNFSSEQGITRETDTNIKFNLIILDDGLNTLAENAQFDSEESIFGVAQSSIEAAMENAIVPALTGIWDQCGIAFQLATLAVVRPEQITLSGGTLDSELFVRINELPEIALNDTSRTRPLELLEQALLPIEIASLEAGFVFDSGILTVFISGARLVSLPGEERNFGGVTTLNGTVSLVRWDSLFFLDQAEGNIVTPTRPITAIAHEFGHNFGLIHSNDSDDPSINSDVLNLMTSFPEQPTAVPPQPTVNLVQSQCDQVEPVAAQLSTF